MAGPFTTSKSSLQSCPLSLALFEIYIEVSLQGWSRKWKMGIHVVPDTFVHHLLSADDQTVLHRMGKTQIVCSRN